MDHPKYAKFDVTDLTYKVFNNQDIKAYVLTPKNITPGSYPIVAKFHGGAFITGGSLYPDWYPQWALDYCLLHSAIIVTGDYRLLPESTGMDIYEDIHDFWDWVRTGLQPYLDQTRPGVEADLSKVIVHGESAGGTIAMLSGFSQPPGFIKAVVATYPGLNLKPKRTKPIMGMGSAPVPASLYKDHLKAMVPGKIVTCVFPPERMALSMSLILHADVRARFWGTDDRISVWKWLEKSETLPYTLVLHGDADTIVPIDSSLEWERQASEKFGDGWGKLHIEPGAEHGFDSNQNIALDTPWLQEYLVKITELWLGDN